MAKQYQSIEPNHQKFILQQRIFFAASAAAEGRVNVSRKMRQPCASSAQTGSLTWIKRVAAMRLQRICAPMAV